ncbi:MAG: hypothetical protein RLZZ250_639, partial [Pseudomonadota bacterium]
VEGNPHQLPGIGSLALTMHPKVAPFTFETNIRIEQDSYIDVIAEDDEGKFFYNQVAIRSAGGCSYKPKRELQYLLNTPNIMDIRLI